MNSPSLQLNENNLNTRKIHVSIIRLFGSKCKFKQRIAIVFVGILFTLLLLLETHFLSLITPLKTINQKYDKNEQFQDKHSTEKLVYEALQQSQKAGENDAEKSKIFEQIIQNIDTHIGVIRRELSVDDDWLTNPDDDDQPNNEIIGNHSDVQQKDKSSDPTLKEVLATSKVVHKYADVFVKIAEILSKPSGGKPYGRRNNRSRATSFKEKLNSETSRVLSSIQTAWPKLGVYSGNITLSHLAHPNGYMKRAGKDFNLSDNVVMQLEGYASKLSLNYEEPSSSAWDTLELYENKDSRELEAWQRWHMTINRYAMYPDDPELVEELLHDLRTQKPVECYEKPNAGTQFKLFYHFENKGRALFKAIRFSREQETLADHYYFSDFERFNAEIAAFHLDRYRQHLMRSSLIVGYKVSPNPSDVQYNIIITGLLGFRRVPPATGRIIHVKDEMQDMADSKLADDIFFSPAGNLCIRGHCDYYCDLHHMICGRPYLIEGVMMAYMPSLNVVDRETWKHPWGRSYIIDTAAEWEKDINYCDEIRYTHPYNEGRRLLDIMDLSVFDFLMNNMDRHHYETFTPFGNDTFIMHLDNGKGFGSHSEDEMTCLYPVIQCCLIRYSTYQKLIDFHHGPIHLGEAMRKSMQSDPVEPVLLNPYLKALDRRLKIILQEIHKCTLTISYEDVIVDDGF